MPKQRMVKGDVKEKSIEDDDQTEWYICIIEPEEKSSKMIFLSGGHVLKEL